MGSKHCSLALDMEDEIAGDNANSGLTLLVNRRYALFGSSNDVGSSSYDVVEFGGTITVSF